MICYSTLWIKIKRTYSRKETRKFDVSWLFTKTIARTHSGHSASRELSARQSSPAGKRVNQHITDAIRTSHVTFPSTNPQPTTGQAGIWPHTMIAEPTFVLWPCYTTRPDFRCKDRWYKSLVGWFAEVVLLFSTYNFSLLFEYTV